MTGQKIKNRLLKIMPAILETKPVHFAYLYGSVAIEQTHPFSDLDIAVYIDPALPKTENLSLEMALSLEIDKNLEDGPPSDVRILNCLPLTVAGQIVTDGILIYCRDDNSRIDYETSVRSAYFDFLPVLRKIQQEHIEQIMDI